jgi:hypothetical protein
MTGVKTEGSFEWPRKNRHQQGQTQRNIVFCHYKHVEISVKKNLSS